MTDSTPTLYVWPAAFGLPSVEPHSLAAALYLQLAAPGKFALVETGDPDALPGGQLPHYTHGSHACTSLADIVAAVPDLDASLSATERAERTAWSAYISTKLGDLVAHALWAPGPNYYPATRAALSQALPLPLRFYVPGRLRDTYKPRLEAAALWDEKREPPPPLFASKAEEEDAKDTATVHKTFAQERVRDLAREVLAPLSRLLGSRSFFFQDRPTSLDVLLAAHILLLSAELPEDTLGKLVASEFPSLKAHADLIRSLAPVPEAKKAPAPAILPLLARALIGASKADANAAAIDSVGALAGLVGVVAWAAPLFMSQSRREDEAQPAKQDS